jgi:pimeloyl-ACP methyl ester carboxylesterase
LLKSSDNPDGPLTPEQAQSKSTQMEQQPDDYLEAFTTKFYSAHGVLQVSEAQRLEALAICQLASKPAALACMHAFATTDFREDLKRISVPTLVIHGDADAIVPFEASGQRTHRAVPHSQLVLVKGAPHGLNLSHAKAFNAALLSFLGASSS